MNKIEKMIKQLCPNGVEWKKLGEVANFKYGYTGTANDNGQARYIRITDINSNGLLNSNDAKYIDITDENKEYLLKKGDIIMARTGATFGKTLYYTAECPSIYASFLIKIGLPSNICPRFYWHFSQSDSYWNQALKYVGGGAQPQFNTNAISQVSIPLPPLPIQTEIVRILDKFVEQQEQLERLIELRKKQYEYYREEMLKPKEGEEWEKVIMSDVCDLKAGKAISASELNDSNAYPCYGGNGIRGYISKYSHEGNFAIIGRQGALCGCVNWATKKFYATEHAVVVTPKNGNDSRFLYLLFTRANLNQYKSAGAQPGLAVNKLNELYFTIPSSKKQKQIVKILDFFETSIATLTTALELSKKRYEYYRDKMLRF